MVGASLAARRAEPTSCQHPFPSRGFDPFAKPQGNDRNSRDADGRSRREAAVADRDRERRKWARKRAFPGDTYRRGPRPNAGIDQGVGRISRTEDCDHSKPPLGTAVINRLDGRPASANADERGFRGAHRPNVQAIDERNAPTSRDCRPAGTGVRNPHALTLIPDHPKGAGERDAILNRRNSEPILEQPAEMRRTAEAV